ncbi:MAG: Fe-S cluster assembly protein SufD [Flavobacteriales bacterium]|nr:Fe-S cluster assembly protein SufD [Flavobacteriales bacterium]
MDTFSTKENTSANDHWSDYRKAWKKEFDKTGFPTRKDENYRYTDIAKIFEQKWDRNTASLTDISLEDTICEKAVRLVFIDGIYRVDLSDTFSNISPWTSENDLGDIDFIAPKNDGVVNYHRSQNEQLYLIELSDKEIIENRVEIHHYFTHEEGASSLRFITKLGNRAELKITERYFNIAGKRYLHHSLSEVKVEKEAHLEWVKIQDQSEVSIVEHTHIAQEEKSNAKYLTISLDGSIVRNNLYFYHQGEYLESELKAITLLKGMSKVDHNTLVYHGKANGYSNQLYKSVYDEKSKGVFNGKIFVEKDAQKTNAFQQNNSIILDRNASLDTKPQLEIFADDVKCSHGCTVGELDEKGLFYMKQRGIPEKEAKAILTYAFLSEALETQKDDKLLRLIRTKVAKKLNVEIDL